MCVKKYLLAVSLILFCISACFAQDTVRRRNRLTDSVLERFYVLKSDPEIKQGPYQAFFKRHTIVAEGNYRQGKKTGAWQFYDAAGKLVEKYNYDNQMFEYEAPLSAAGYLTYIIDDTLKKGDKVRRPVRTGGIYYGYIPYINIFQTPFDTFDVNTDTFEANIELLISPFGRLADYKVRLTSDYYDYDHIFNLDVKLFNDEDRQFLPATLNGQRVLSRIIIKCAVNSDGTLDFD